MDKKHLLVVDDQAEIGAFIKDVAEPLDYDVTVTIDAANFMRFYNQVMPDTIAMDVFMPNCDGIEIIRGLIQARCSSRILVMSGADEFFLNSVFRLALDQGLRNVRMMKKPLHLNDLRAFLLEEFHPTTAQIALH